MRGEDDAPTKAVDTFACAAVSIPTNIAEGHGQFSKGVFSRHLCIARGALHELETRLEISQRLNYLDAPTLEKATLLADEIGRMLWVLIEKLGTRKWNYAPNLERPACRALNPSLLPASCLLAVPTIFTDQVSISR